MLINGELDHLPEQAFYMVGGAEDAMRKAKEMECSSGRQAVSRRYRHPRGQ